LLARTNSIICATAGLWLDAWLNGDSAADADWTMSTEGSDRTLPDMITE
jgi:hypothetical protein